jgi:GxxExxY protein
MPEQLKYDDITHKIIGCAMRVHTKLGNGFQEVIYQRSLEIEMALESISFEREKEMAIFYRGVEVGTRRVDFFVENLIMVELKALIELEDVHLSQGLNYLEAYNVEVGLLLNFGSKSLTYKRLLNKKFKQQ